MELFLNLIHHCSSTIRLTLVKADLIPQFINSLNPQSLPLSEAVDIHINVMKIIWKSIWLATPDGLASLEIEDRNEQQAVHEMVLKQVLVPSEKNKQEPTNLPNGLRLFMVALSVIRILSRQSRSMVATLSFSFASTLARSDSDTVSVFDVAGSDQRCAPLLRRTRLSHSRHPTPFHALSQPIAVLGETHKPTTSLPLSDFLFQHWTISLEVLIQRFPDATNQALFFPGFRQVFQRSGKHTQSLLLQAVLEKLEQRLRVLADEACGTRNVTQTRFLEGVGEQAEWERGVIESAIDTGQLDYAITTIIPRETLCTPKREPDLLHILQLLFSFYKTVNRLTLVFPDDTSFPDEYTWCRRFRPPLTSIRSAVLYAIQDESTTSENVRRLSRFFSFVFMLTDPECIPQHDDSERMLVHSFQSSDPSDEIVAVQMREEGFEDRLQALLHKDQEDYAVRELDEMNVGSETSRPCPYFGMRHVGLQLVLSPLLTLALVLTPSSLPSPPLLLVSPLSTVHTPSNPSHLSQPTLHSVHSFSRDWHRSFGHCRPGTIPRRHKTIAAMHSQQPPKLTRDELNFEKG
ncbi:hypothetical protein BLNAU_18205 [Blattamonas nauphoetae]|uniref:Uncharacterized protein n=1 Tax=Blattamonas nauphoetae TaxID=2049346 RepID=A0ABQ9X557_9EUKA|nr:hypothetical protein BLNAU_18205 [Blattamonas nauphoetae]